MTLLSLEISKSVASLFDGGKRPNQVTQHKVLISEESASLLHFKLKLQKKKKKSKNLCCAFELKHLIMPSLNYLNTYFPFTHFNQLFYQNLNPVHSFPTQTKSLKEKEKENSQQVI